ncbi:MAG: polysaccharide deacetylase family protein [Halorhabdus sp.]
MSDTGEEFRTVVDRRRFLTIAGTAGLATLAGCGKETATDDGSTPMGTATSTSTTADRSIDTPGEPSRTEHQSEPSTEAKADTETETETEAKTGTKAGSKPDPEVPQSAGGPLGPLPTPDRNGVPRPDGEPGGLAVLDWAGFEGAVTYTFDDGQPSQLEHYDALEATGMNMTFYLSTNVSFDGYETGWRQAARDGHELGNHTVSHPYADFHDNAFGKPLDSTNAEIKQCNAYITNNLGQDAVWTMAFPYGDDGWRKPAKQSDLFVARDVGGGRVAPDDDTNPYKLPCYMARKGDTATTFTERIDRARANGEWQIFLFHTIAPTDAVWYAPVDIDEITSSVEHAKSAGDVWIDTTATIGAYWRGQRILTNANQNRSDGKTVWKWSLPDSFPSGQVVRVTVDGGTLSQDGTTLDWNSHGYYEVALDEESLTLSA